MPFNDICRGFVGRHNYTGIETTALDCMQANTKALSGDEGSNSLHPAKH